MLTEQFMPILHFLISFLTILFLVPWIFFRNPYPDGMEKIASHFLKMSFILLALGYTLAILKLFEAMSIAFLLVVIGIRIQAMRQKKGGLEDSVSHFEALIYDYFDGKYQLKQVVYTYARQLAAQLKDFAGKRWSTPYTVVGTCSLLGIVALAGYIRFYDALFHAAPSFGNRYSLLHWIKDVRINMLFSDGIVYQGFYVFWAGIQEFARLDTLYISKYTGPLSLILIMLGLYFFLSRLTGSRFSGIAGVIVFALLGEYIDPHYREWQTEADPRTFAYVFYLPTLYFLVLYFRGMNRDAWLTMMAGTTAIALIDPVVFLQLAAGMFMVILILIVTQRKKSGASITKVFLSWAAAAAVSILPLLYGFVSGKTVHTMLAQMFQLNPADPYILTAAPSFLSLVISATAGFVWHYLAQCLNGYAYKKWLEPSLVILVIGISGYFTSFQPIQPMKVDWDEAAEQYLTISKEWGPRSWMIVGKDSWSAMARGRGYHMNIHEFVQNYAASKWGLIRNGAAEPDLNIPSDVFIFYEKRLREVNDDLAAAHLSPMYSRWEQERGDLRSWLDRYYALHPEMEIYFEDENIVIYHFEHERGR